ncbi:MarR family winged helix-turn-helix transcriptional regulator [Streptomyces sp. C184]|uniref:MarR family winged helix-turn-helix transcriptional regulator n=1 Tax=Streptomyces sp. C184 TaxID=3237121 RepID=UPI0034C671A3
MQRQQGPSSARNQGPAGQPVPEMRHKSFHLMRRALQEHNAHWQTRFPHLTKPQYAALSAVGEQPGIEQSAVATAAGIDKATLAAVLLRLEQRGLITRAVDPDDRRRRLVHLTDEGDQEIRNVFPVAGEVDALLLDRLTPQEREQLQQLLTKLTTTP